MKTFSGTNEQLSTNHSLHLLQKFMTHLHDFCPKLTTGQLLFLQTHRGLPGSYEVLRTWLGRTVGLLANSPRSKMTTWAWGEGRIFCCLLIIDKVYRTSNKQTIQKTMESMNTTFEVTQAMLLIRITARN